MHQVEEQRPLFDPVTLRRAALQGVATGGLLSAAVYLLVTVTESFLPGTGQGTVPFLTFLLGLTAGLLAVVEAGARQRPLTRRRIAAAVGVSWLLAACAGVLLLPEWVYVVDSLLIGNPPQHAVQTSLLFVTVAVRESGYVLLPVLCGAAFAIVVWGRLARFTPTYWLAALFALWMVSELIDRSTGGPTPVPLLLGRTPEAQSLVPFQSAVTVLSSWLAWVTVLSCLCYALAAWASRSDPTPSPE